MSTQLTVRLPDDLVNGLDALVPHTHTTRSHAVQRAVELYLYRLACERDARQYERMPLTAEELAFIDDPDIWRTMPPWVMGEGKTAI